MVRDYVSGAMENTTATLHGDFLQQTDRELLDETWEDADQPRAVPPVVRRSGDHRIMEQPATQRSFCLR